MVTIRCNRNNYGQKRSHNDVKFVVIHYTAGDTDTARNEGVYFSREHKPHTSAHFFVDREGNIVKSVPLDHVAWAVGGKKYPGTKGGKYYGICTNYNSVSIELCGNLKKDPSEKQIEAVNKVIKYIRKYCRNINGYAQIIRHYDVTGKLCPARMVDENKWHKFKARIKLL